MCCDVLAVHENSSNRVCRHRDVLKYLNVTKNKEQYAMTRPGSSESPTVVYLDIFLYAILDVNEKDQKFISYLWVDLSWQGDDLSWNPDDFCGISHIHIPHHLLWRPDLTIGEMTEKDKSLQSPHVMLNFNGTVSTRNDMVVSSTCKIQVYKFPFDIQSCKLSFKSILCSDVDLKLLFYKSTTNTLWSLEMMQNHSEWYFMDISTSNTTVNNFGLTQDILVYNIIMRRNSALYIVNFLLPIVFFLCLDLASFLISESGGEKLSFKVTVLLAVTVMQLILNEILPSSSDRIPLIAVYCIGSFTLMMLSLLETMLVMYLMERDSTSQANEVDKDCGYKYGKGSSSQLMLDSDSEQISDELSEAVKTLTLLLNSMKEERKPGYWTRMAKIINRVALFALNVSALSFNQ
ncbi:5-hydroxytryptamine receptor 3A-like [Clinocottus analis]|uniref:5-hydroxytryptamine receptor 3A-like n=1 Tax=Clinocottus analis TaxID=304258 RepID=UPI0035BF9EBB